MALDPPSMASRPTDVNPAPHTMKRRASQELTATSDCETNPNKRPNRSERDGNVHSAQVESRDTNVEIGNTARPVCPKPSPQMQAALAEACRKRDERRSNEKQKRDEDAFWREYSTRLEDPNNEA
ncbi:hypothetical protein J4E85_009503 [Alternaria conjuncta]|uniref:uncharacterized protein n=1 Tax=Alternaria conjuncta TaxID=181017 RepID=UPI00221FD8ED|nr:uncharacterized protein J4E85_009503 [Alternaria conjuncta]KAI4919245.1 hypothetical protein J4E85_009503 [Alternaria conjuncta]